MIEEEEFEFDPELEEKIDAGYDIATAVYHSLRHGEVKKASEALKDADLGLVDFALKLVLSNVRPDTSGRCLKSLVSVCLIEMQRLGRKDERNLYAKLIVQLIHQHLNDTDRYTRGGFKSVVMGKEGGQHGTPARKLKHQHIRTLAREMKNNNPGLSNNSIAVSLIKREKTTYAKSTVLRILRGPEPNSESELDF